MNKEKKKHTVTIFGDQYTLVSDEPQEHLMHVAAFVDSFMHDIAEASKMSDAKKIAVLASLQIAEKLLALEIDTKKGNERQKALIDKIDRACFSISSS